MLTWTSLIRGRLFQAKNREALKGTVCCWKTNSSEPLLEAMKGYERDFRSQKSVVIRYLPYTFPLHFRMALFLQAALCLFIALFTIPTLSHQRHVTQGTQSVLTFFSFSWMTLVGEISAFMDPP